MTANAMKGDDEKCFEAGMDDYIAKPIDATMLQQKIERWIGKGHPKTLS
jgi:CheY-like chemotaxis protein